MAADLSVRSPYTDSTFAVVERVGDKLIGRGFFKSRGLAEKRLFEMRDQRKGARR